MIEITGLIFCGPDGGDMIYRRYGPHSTLEIYSALECQRLERLYKITLMRGTDPCLQLQDIV